LSVELKAVLLQHDNEGITAEGAKGIAELIRSNDKEIIEW
jgi:hypothetical protein